MNKHGLENAREMMRELRRAENVLRDVRDRADLGGWFYVRSDLGAAYWVVQAAIDNLKQEVYLENGGEGMDALDSAEVVPSKP